jgi:hypothetical protein
MGCSAIGRSRRLLKEIAMVYLENESGIGYRN